MKDFEKDIKKKCEKKFGKDITINHETRSEGFEFCRVFDKDGNEIYYANNRGLEYYKSYEKGKISHYSEYQNGKKSYERWLEYDQNGNEIHYKDSNGTERWNEYDQNGKLIHYKDSNGTERWWEYDQNGNEIHFKDSEGYDVNGDCYYRFPDKCEDCDKNTKNLPRTEKDHKGRIKEFDKDGHMIYYYDPEENFESWVEYNEFGKVSHYKNTLGLEWWKDYDKNGNLLNYYNTSNGTKKCFNIKLSEIETDDSKEDIKEYYDNGLLKYHKDFNGYEYFYEYNEEGILIKETIKRP